MVAHARKIGPKTRLQRESVARPGSVEEDKRLAIWLDAIRAGAAAIKRHRIERLPKADIGEPRAVEFDEQCEVVELRTESAGIAGHARGQQSDAESEIAEQQGEHAVELVTKSAAATGHNFIEQALRVEHDRTRRVYIQILERNAKQVGALQTPQRLQSCVA